MPCFILSGDVLSDTLHADVYLRIVTSLIALSLLYEPLWNRGRRRGINFWVLAVTFCLPFSYVAQYMLEGGTQFNVVNVAVAFTIMASLLNWASLLLFSSIGVAAAILLCINIGVDPNLIADNDYILVYTTLMSSVVGLMFFQYRDTTIEDKHGMIEAFASTMAHDSKTPIVGMHSEASLTKNLLEDFKQEFDKTGKVNMKLIDMAIESCQEKHRDSPHCCSECRFPAI